MGCSLFSQNLTWVYDEEKGYDIPIGIGKYEELKDGAFYEEMKKYYDAYSLNMNVIKQLNELVKKKFLGEKLDVVIVFGAWCGDSKEHLPHFYKVMENIDFLTEDDILLIACDRDKKAGSVDIEDLEIEFVPTFILRVDGEEINRIVETPEASLEKDMLTILKIASSAR